MKTILGRLTLLQLACTLVVFLVLFGFLHYQFKNVVEANFDARGQTVVAALAKAIEPSLVNHSLPEVQSELDAAVNDSGAAWGLVLSPDKHILAHTFVPEVPSEIEQAALSGRFDHLIVRVYRQPVLEGFVATVFIGLDKEQVSASVLHMEARVLLSILAVMSLATLGFIAFARIIVGPIRALTRVAQSIAESPAHLADFQPLPGGGEGEAAALTASFNQMGQVILAHQRQLEARVAHRTQLLHQANQELQMARDASDSDNVVKTEFLAHMSHEIRTPLNGIIGMAEMVLLSDLRPEQSEYMRMLQQSAHTLLTTINEVLDFSKIEAGRLELDLVSFDIQGLAYEVIRPLAAASEKKGIELLCHVDRSIPRLLLGDPLRLRQVLSNLLGNAVKFTDYGEVELAITATVKADVATVFFQVRDTGIGIPDAALATIFDPFQQADISTSRKYGGSGLGLSICKKLVDLMGGTLHVQSQARKGSTFSFQAELPIADPAPVPGPEVEPTGKSLHGVSVLLADAHKAVRTQAREILESAGLDVTEAASTNQIAPLVEQARQKQQPFSLLLIDTRTAEEQPWGFFDSVRPTTVLLMGLGLPAAEAAGNPRTNVCGYVLKPLHPTELIVAVGRGLAPQDVLPLAIQHCSANQHPTLRVLVVDDNWINQRVACALLEKMGHRVDVVSRGAAAIKVSETTRYDLLLMDAEMPDMDGWETTRRIRNREQRTGGRVPILALTANNGPGTRDRCLDAGMDDFVSKPVDRQELELKIRQALIRASQFDLSSR